MIELVEMVLFCEGSEMPYNEPQIWIPEHLMEFPVWERKFGVVPNLQSVLHPDRDPLAVFQNDTLESYLQGSVDKGLDIEFFLIMNLCKFIKGILV